MKIKVSNTYQDGWESESVDDVPDFDRAVHGEGYDEDEEMSFYLQQFTGDGHGIGKEGGKLGYWGEITILKAADPALVGQTFEYD